jgi:hypothetical protein
MKICAAGTAMERSRQCGALTVFFVALAATSPALAQSAPEQLSPAAVTVDTDQSEYVVVPIVPDTFFHHWRATLDYSYREGPLVDVDLNRDGKAHSNQVILGLEAGIGRYGFGRIEAGVDFGESERTLRFDDMKGDFDRRFIGASGGVFVLPFLALGAEARYGGGEEEDVLTNRFFGEVTETDRDDKEWRASPFALLTAPFGPVQLSLLGAYSHVERESDYSDPTLPDNDRASMDLWMVNGGADWHISPEFTLGANVGWTRIVDQDLQTGAVPLDDEWGSAGGHLIYRLLNGLELTVRGGHDFDNSQGNGFRVGGGIAYRF